MLLVGAGVRLASLCVQPNTFSVSLEVSVDDEWHIQLLMEVIVLERTACWGHFDCLLTVDDHADLLVAL